MSSSNKLNGTDRLSKLFGNIIVSDSSDIQSMNSIFGAIRRDREGATAAANPSAPGTAPIAEERRKALGRKHGGNVAIGRDSGKISAQTKGNREPATRTTKNNKLKPFKDSDAGKNETAGPAPREVLREKVIAQEYFSPHIFEIRPVIGEKQVGMFATSDIEKDTEILREAPVIRGGPTWPGREAAYNMLSSSKKTAVDSLSSMCNCGKKPELCLETPLMKRWAVNSFEMNPFLQAGDTANNNHVYDKACRINHACIPNCSRAFNSEHSISIRAMEDIKKGVEITINYGVYGPASFRESNIAERWKFTCTCNACVKKGFVPETGYEEYQHNKRLLCFQFPHLVPLGAETAEEAATSKEIIEWADVIENDILEAEAYWYAHTDELVRKGITRLRFTLEWTDLNQSPTRNFLVNGHERFLREDNRYTLSDKVIKLYIWRATKALRAEVDRCHPVFMRKHS
ncbi:putative set domain-containing protein 5 protein [Botrytis fragariae]|uniref:Putative set domain-containing protein 5 protein n=1 Tax=Botrytis fragariae TaxID=1964551 RepID=A0A8H6EFJ4_9HELO|nr:putative set domain-containing protein 5 protein [Botrytis fragariae]KAF5870509.1 putative set domain-containing protein 5 protein [Botrytis fragariae]